jgi:hypothetical protein
MLRDGRDGQGGHYVIDVTLFVNDMAVLIGVSVTLQVNRFVANLTCDFCTHNHLWEGGTSPFVYSTLNVRCRTFLIAPAVENFRYGRHCPDRKRSNGVP